MKKHALHIILSAIFFSSCALAGSEDFCKSPQTVGDLNRINRALQIQEHSLVLTKAMNERESKAEKLGRYELNVLHHLPDQSWKCARMKLNSNVSNIVQKAPTARVVEFLFRYNKILNLALNDVSGKREEDKLLFDSINRSLLAAYKKLKGFDPLQDDSIHQQLIHLGRELDRVEDERTIQRFTVQ